MHHLLASTDNTYPRYCTRQYIREEMIGMLGSMQIPLACLLRQQMRISQQRHDLPIKPSR